MGNVFPRVFPNIKPYIDDKIFSCSDDESDDSDDVPRRKETSPQQFDQCIKYNQVTTVGYRKILTKRQQNQTTSNLLENRVNMLISSLSKENYGESLSYAKLIKECVTSQNQRRTSPRKYNSYNNDKKNLSDKILVGGCKSAPLCSVEKSPDNVTEENRCTNVKMDSGDHLHTSPQKRVQRTTALARDPQIQCNDLISRHGILHRATNKPQLQNQQHCQSSKYKSPSIVGIKRRRANANSARPTLAQNYRCFSQYSCLPKMHAVDSQQELNGNRNHGGDGGRDLTSSISSSKLFKKPNSSFNECVTRGRANPRRSCLTNSHSISFVREPANIPRLEIKTKAPKVEQEMSCLSLQTTNNNGPTCVTGHSKIQQFPTKSLERRKTAKLSRWGGHIIDKMEATVKW